MKKNLIICAAVLTILLAASVALADEGWDKAWTAVTSRTGFVITFLYDEETASMGGVYRVDEEQYFLYGSTTTIAGLNDVVLGTGYFTSCYNENTEGTWKGVFFFDGYCYSDYSPIDGYWMWPTDPPGSEEFTGYAIDPGPFNE